MGKFKKNSPAIKFRNEPLEKQLSDEIIVKNRQKLRNRRDNDDEFVDSSLSHKILEQARKQQEELEDEHPTVGPVFKTTFTENTTENDELSDDDDDDELPVEDQQYYENIEFNEEDEKALEKFMNENPVSRLPLADAINDKISEKRTELQSQCSEKEGPSQIDPKVQEVFKGIGEVLSRYRSGKIPKLFKLIPRFANWEDMLHLTNPTKWTAAAVYMATRIFASNLKEKMAQIYYNTILLPRIRDDITEYKRLNFHLYESLKKAMYKPGAFMKGILLPLCESGRCSLREAIIVGSVIEKVSIPMYHSATAMMKIAEMDYNGANSIFLRILFDKKYALPYRTLDACVAHFLRFQNNKLQLPVLWHQSLLTFVQHYKSEISSEQREALLDLLKSQRHPTISAEIRRELEHAQSRDIEGPEHVPMDQ